jgi:hypothetical protein
VAHSIAGSVSTAQDLDGAAFRTCFVFRDWLPMLLKEFTGSFVSLERRSLTVKESSDLHQRISHAVQASQAARATLTRGCIGHHWVAKASQPECGCLPVTGGSIIGHAMRVPTGSVPSGTSGMYIYLPFGNREVVSSGPLADAH